MQTISLALEQTAGVSTVNIDLKEGSALVEYDPGILSVKSIIDIVESLGFDASEAIHHPVSKETSVSIQFMHCQSCVSTITDALVAIDGVLSAVINLESESGKIVSRANLDPESIITCIQECGFEAQIADVAIYTQTLLNVEFITCNSCVETITEVLLGIPGVKSAQVDLDSKSADILALGTLDVQKLIVAIQDCGFDASVASHLRTQSSTVSEKTFITPPFNPFYVDERPTTKALGAEIPMEMLRGFKKDSNLGINPSAVTKVFQIKGMTCASCVYKLEKALNAHPEIILCRVALALEQATIEYMDQYTTSDRICQMVSAAGFTANLLVKRESGKVTLQILGMTCASCSGKVEKALYALSGIISASVNLLGQSATVEYTSDLGVRDIVECIESLGFDALLVDDNSDAQKESLQRTAEIKELRKAFLTALAFALPVSLISMVLPYWIPEILQATMVFPGLETGHVANMLLTIPVQFYVGGRFYKAAWKALQHGSATMDVLVVIGTSLAFIYSCISILHSMYRHGNPRADVFFETSATLVTFVTLGRLLETRAKAATSTALSALLSLAPDTALLIQDDDVVRSIPAEYIKQGDRLKILPGERIPADGEVYFGDSSTDESLLTGEAMSVRKIVGDSVICGSVNGNGVLHITADRVGSDTTLAHIVQMVSDAQTSKAPIQAVADRVSAIFVPVILALGLATFIGWMVVIGRTGWIPKAFPQTTDHMFVCLSISISVIVVACPCALGLATPTAVMVGTGVGARHGILIKGGGPLSVSPKISMMVFDKTGTLTNGKMEIVASHFPLGLFDGDTIMQIAGLLESNSEHPIGKSIANHCKETIGECAFSVKDFMAIPGQGVVGTIYNCEQVHQVAIGNASLLKSMNASCQNAELAEQYESQGCTVVMISIDSKYAGMLCLSDTIKSEAVHVIEQLNKMGIESVMVTGDQPATAKYIASQCGIQRVFAGTSPAGKRELVAEFQSQGITVGMIGDGVNDSPSLAQADLGVCVYGGSQVAVQAASIVLMQENLWLLVTAIDLSRTISRRIWLNYLWATLYNVAMVPLAMGLGAPWGIFN